MSDPLLLLRASLQSPTPPVLLLSADPSPSNTAPSLAISTHLLLPPHPTPLPKTLPTRVLRPGESAASAPSPADHPDAFHTLDAVFYCWLARADGPGDYFRKARDAALSSPAVSLVDRRAVLAYLTDPAAPAPERIVPLPSPAATLTDHPAPPGADTAEHPGAEAPAHPTASYIAPPDGPTTPPGSPPPGHVDRLKGGDARHPSGTGAGTGTKRRYVPDAADVEFVKRLKAEEVELRDRRSVLRGLKVNNYAELRSSIQRRLKLAKDPSKAGPARVAPSADASKSKKAKNQFPIIMISSSPTSLITMHNVKRFLEEADFLPSSEARNLALSLGTTKAEDVIPIYRKRVLTLPSGEVQERQMKYFVVDGVEALGKFGFGGDPWDRVVCVMTTGQSWQFKPYKWPDPKQLFHNVKGIYVQWTHDPPNNAIKDWNVTVLKIDQSRRHVDKSVVAQFWKELDNWTGVHKPYLALSG